MSCVKKHLSCRPAISSSGLQRRQHISLHSNISVPCCYRDAHPFSACPFLSISLVVVRNTCHAGRAYLQVDCNQVNMFTCAQTSVYHSATQMRIAGLTVQQFWMALTVVRGRRDVQAVPYHIGRLGRVLMRLRISRDMGLNHGGLLGVGLLLSTALAHAPCSSCAQSWLLLASNLQATTMVVLAAFLFKPVKPSKASGLVMQGRANSRLSQEMAMSLYGLQHLQLLRDTLTGTKCLVAWGSNHLVITFRGTANMKNAAHDTKAWLLPLVDEGPSSGCMWHRGPAVHAGFRASWHAGLKTSVMSLITEAVCSSAEQASKMNVYLAGHSLGGAMAVIAALDIADLFPWQTLQVYTMGAPRPGNKAFTKACNARVPSIWNIINEADPIPMVAKFGALYSRPGHRVLVSPRGDLLVRPSPLDLKLNKGGSRVDRHKLTAYTRSLEEVITVQLSQPKFENGLQGVLELAESIDLSSTLLTADLVVGTPTHIAAAAANTPLSVEASII